MLRLMQIALVTLLFIVMGGLIYSSASAQPVAHTVSAPELTATNTPVCQPNWSIVSSPSVGSGANLLRRIAIVSPDDIWAAGRYYSTGTGSLQTLIQHWNGTQWAVVSSPNASTGDNNLNEIKAISASDIWAVGDYVSAGVKHTMTLHYNGVQWSIVPSADGQGYSYITGVAAIASNDVWIVGFYCPGECFSGSIPGLTLTEHWNGSTWTIVPSPNVNTDSYLWGVTAISSNDVWAVGRSNSCFGCAPDNLFLHWNGTSWSVVPSPRAGSSSNDLYDIVALNANDIWAVGDYYTGSGTWRTLILHWDGTQWSVVPSPNPDGVNNHLNGVGPRASNDAWAVGIAGNPGRTLVLHWDGASWSVVSSESVAGQTNELLGVSPISSNEAWTVGYAGNHTLVEHYTGECSSATSTPAPTNTGVPSTSTSTPLPTGTPGVHDAFAHLEPAGPLTVTVGSQFTLSLMVNSGSNNINAAQNYLTFTDSLLQVVNASQSDCVLTSTASPDTTVFDALLQNEICNGPNPCNFRGITTAPGSIAYASGALANPSAHGDFRVAQLAFCASAAGDALIHWQFSPPAPLTRDSEIIAENGDLVGNRNLYTDYAVHIASSGMLVGHGVWQARPAQPNPLQQLPITLALRSGASGADYASVSTDTSGQFTVSVSALPGGTYNWWAKGPGYLANAGTVTLGGSASTSVEMGLMRGGDANNDNVVTTLDFNILKGTFGTSIGGAGYDPRADFDGDNVVNASDFNVLRSNFGQGGAQLSRPAP